MNNNFFKTCTVQLIFVNVVLYFAFLIVAGFIGIDKAFSYVALQPAMFLSGKHLWTILTSMFMHANLGHLFVNMFSLFFIGSFVEKLIGKKRFFWFYILSGIFAGIFFALVSGFFGFSDWGMRIFGSPYIAGVGASGALFGLVGVLAMLTPRARVYLIAGPLVAIILEFALSGILGASPIMTALSFVINVYFIFSLFAILSFNPTYRRLAIPIEMPFWVLPIVAIVPLVIIGLFIELPIGNMAHLGGLLAGLGYAAFLKNKYPRKTAMIERMFS